MNKTRVVNLKREEYDVYIGRGSIYGNPFKIGIDGTRKEVVMKYKKYIKKRIKNYPRMKAEFMKKLKGKILGCYCKPRICHGDILVELLDD